MGNGLAGPRTWDQLERMDQDRPEAMGNGYWRISGEEVAIDD